MKWSRPGNGVAPFLTPCVVAIEMGANFSYLLFCSRIGYDIGELSSYSCLF